MEEEANKASKAIKKFLSRDKTILGKIGTNPALKIKKTTRNKKGIMFSDSQLK